MPPDAQPRERAERWTKVGWSHSATACSASPSHCSRYHSQFRPPGGPLQQLLRRRPSCAAYLISFLTIGCAWLDHHLALTDRLTRVDAIFLRINLLVLLGKAALPFPTRLGADAAHPPRIVLDRGRQVFVCRSHTDPIDARI